MHGGRLYSTLTCSSLWRRFARFTRPGRHGAEGHPRSRRSPTPESVPRWASRRPPSGSSASKPNHLSANKAKHADGRATRVWLRRQRAVFFRPRGPSFGQDVQVKVPMGHSGLSVDWTVLAMKQLNCCGLSAETGTDKSEARPGEDGPTRY